MPLRLIHGLKIEEVDLHHNLKCEVEAQCLEWVTEQRRPRWRAYTCRYCWRWEKKPPID